MFPVRQQALSDASEKSDPVCKQTRFEIEEVMVHGGLLAALEAGKLTMKHCLEALAHKRNEIAAGFNAIRLQIDSSERAAWIAYDNEVLSARKVMQVHCDALEVKIRQFSARLVAGLQEQDQELCEVEFPLPRVAFTFFDVPGLTRVIAECFQLTQQACSCLHPIETTACLKAFERSMEEADKRQAHHLQCKLELLREVTTNPSCCHAGSGFQFRKICETKVDMKYVLHSARKLAVSPDGAHAAMIDCVSANMLVIADIVTRYNTKNRTIQLSACG